MSMYCNSMIEVRRRAHAVPRKAGFPPGIFLADALSYATMRVRIAGRAAMASATSKRTDTEFDHIQKELWWSKIQILVVKVVVKSDSAGV